MYPWMLHVLMRATRVYYTRFCLLVSMIRWDILSTRIYDTMILSTRIYNTIILSTRIYDTMRNFTFCFLLISKSSHFRTSYITFWNIFVYVKDVLVFWNDIFSLFLYFFSYGVFVPFWKVCTFSRHAAKPRPLLLNVTVHLYCKWWPRYSKYPVGLP